MSAKQGTIWTAEPHTIAKIEMLRSYLQTWFSILGATFKGRDLWYIDGFAGPGEYENYKQGSPIAALAAAEAARNEVARWLAGSIRCVFIEQDRARYDNLVRKLAETPERQGIARSPFHGAFVEGVAWLREQTTNPFVSGDPVFAFIDPFGAKGMSFNVVRDLLSRRSCEVLVNLDSDGVGRIYQAGEDAGHRTLLNDIFGDEEWEAELANAGPLHEAARRVLALYKRKLRAIPQVAYAFSFEMRKQYDILDYHLVFASQHPRGLEKMKEVMKKIDKNGSYCFSDDHVGQSGLFTFDDADGPAQQMHRYFQGREVPYAEVNAYALNESPFTNAKGMLKVLEDAQRISVSVGTANRRKCTYPDALHPVMRIRFR